MSEFFKACQKTVFIAMPMVATNLISALMGIISMFLVSLMGHEALAAGALISSSYSFIMMIGISFLIPVSIMIGQSRGAGNLPEIGRWVQHGFILAMLLGCVLSTIMLNMYPLLIFFRKPPEIAKIVAGYFHALSFGIFPIMLATILNQFLNGILKPKMVTLFSLISLLGNTLLGFALVKGKWFLPALGVEGVAYAIAFMSWLMLFVLFIYIARTNEFKKFQIFSLLLPSKNYFKKLLNMGWPMSVQYGVELLAFTMITYLMGTLGPVALGAQQITLQCAMIPIMIVVGISQATSILVGQAFGQRNFNQIMQQFHVGLFLVVLTMLTISECYWHRPDFFISIFLDIHNPVNQSIKELSVILLSILAFTQIFDGIRNVTTSALRGLGDMRFPMMMGVLSCWVIAMPISLLCMLKWGAVGIRIGFLIGILTGAIVLVTRFYQINSLKEQCIIEA